MAIEVGKAAPAFSLPASTGETISLKQFKGEKAVVLYFYPKDATPGCTQEACDFRDLTKEIEAAGAVVLGVSPDSVESHKKFAEAQALSFPLLADPEKTVIEKYGAWGEKTMYGKTSMGVIRSTVLIGKDGKVARRWPKVSVNGHAAEVLEAVKAL